jgi:hypothetical protein
MTFTPSDYLARAETADPETAAMLRQAEEAEGLPNLLVTRYCKRLSDFRPRSGDYLKVGDIDLGEFQDIVDAVAAGNLPDVRQQEGHQQQPTAPHPGRDPENRLVHVSPHP